MEEISNGDIACFSEEQQKFFNSLTDKQQKYVIYRGMNYSKKDAYEMAGFKGNRLSQAVYNLEKTYPLIPVLYNLLMKHQATENFIEGRNDVVTKIDALAEKVNKRNYVPTDGDKDLATRIQLYRDIINGVIITKKVHKVLDKQGKLVKWTIDEIDDVHARMAARKELDRLIGGNAIPIGKVKANNITINIVDASKREEIEDSRNVVDLSSDEAVVLDAKDFGTPSEGIEDLEMADGE